MKIVHLCIEAPYNDYWGYQDNLLPKYHRKQGHEVTVITTNTMQKDGKTVPTEAGRYFLKDGQQIIRVAYSGKPGRKLAAMRKYPIYDLLCELKPDFIMVHGLGNGSVLQVKRYIKACKPNCRVVADNHLDEYIAAKYKKIPAFLIQKYCRLVNRRMRKVYETVFGVTPGRVEYMQKHYGIAKERSALLVMGADDDAIDFANKTSIRKQLREEYGIPQDDFLIVTGGKIDRLKNIHVLLQAFAEADLKNASLLVFGNVHESIRDEIESLCKHPKVYNIGWIEANKAYDCFLAADLAAFPGAHSVLWEQACACGIPCIFKDDPGRRHIDVGGNCLRIQELSELKPALQKLCSDRAYYEAMKQAAEEKGIDCFSYDSIAKRVLQPRDFWVKK